MRHSFTILLIGKSWIMIIMEFLESQSLISFINFSIPRSLFPVKDIQVTVRSGPKQLFFFIMGSQAFRKYIYNGMSFS